MIYPYSSIPLSTRTQSEPTPKKRPHDDDDAWAHSSLGAVAKAHLLARSESQSSNKSFNSMLFSQAGSSTETRPTTRSHSPIQTNADAYLKSPVNKWTENAHVEEICPKTVTQQTRAPKKRTPFITTIRQVAGSTWHNLDPSHDAAFQEAFKRPATYQKSLFTTPLTSADFNLAPGEQLQEIDGANSTPKKKANPFKRNKNK